MAYEYKRIEDLTQLTSLNKNDQFLVARSSATGASYASYRTMLETLSSQIKVTVTAMNTLVNNIANCNGNTLCAATAQLTYNNYVACSNLQTSYNSLHSTVTTLNNTLNNLQTQVNTLNTTVTNIQNANIVPMFRNQAPVITVYKVISNPSKNKYNEFKDIYLSSDASPYWKQPPGTISCIQKDFAKKPIIHYVTQNSNVVVIANSGYTHVFMNSAVSQNPSQYTKQYLHANHVNLSNSMYSIGSVYNKLTPISLGICRVGTMLFIYDNADTNKDTARITPRVSDGYGVGQAFRIEEFPV